MDKAGARSLAELQGSYLERGALGTVPRQTGDDSDQGNDDPSLCILILAAIPNPQAATIHTASSYQLLTVRIAFKNDRARILDDILHLLSVDQRAGCGGNISRSWTSHKHYFEILIP